jgi:uncharacterized protein (UPF0332 family)
LNEFERCVEKGRLLPASAGPEELARELDEAAKDHVQAQRRLTGSRFEDATVNAYHAMYHAARTLLLARGYRERNLYCLSAGLRRFYVAGGALDESQLQILAVLKDARDRIQAGGRSDREEATSAVAAAGLMLQRAGELLAPQSGTP